MVTQIEQLKAKAYDLVLQIQFLEQQLRQINGMIAEIAKQTKREEVAGKENLQEAAKLGEAVVNTNLNEQAQAVSASPLV